LASFLIIVMIARMWGRTSLGEYSTVWVWLTMFQFLSVFGMAEYISKEVGAARAKAREYLTHALLFGLLSSLMCTVIMAGAAVLFDYPNGVKYAIVIASLALPFASCNLICEAVFTAFQKIKYIALANILENVLFLLLGSAVILKGYGLLALVWSMVLVRLVSSALNLFIAHRYIAPLHFPIDWKFLRGLIAPVTVFGLTNAAYQIFIRIDVVMLSKMKDMVTVGLYSSASRLMGICLLLPLSFHLLNLPVAAHCYKNFPESMPQKIEARIEEFFILIFMVFGMCFFFSRDILSVIFGVHFTEASLILRILMLGFLIWSAEIILGTCCQAAGYQKINMYIIMIQTGINIVLNYVFIPVWGALGAALAMLVSISFSFAIFQYFTCRTLIGRFQWIRMTWKPGLVCLFLMLMLSPLADRLNVVLTALMFLSGYALMLFALNGFSLDRAKTLYSWSENESHHDA